MRCSTPRITTPEFRGGETYSACNMKKEQLNGVLEEINLLKMLDNPNIVRYIDTVKTEEHLHIVLEYVENGSLSDIVTRFGPFSETLCAVYISQVLKGLKYLHKQGVIHRDIKGANILTTKDGQVKLADFWYREKKAIAERTISTFAVLCGVRASLSRIITRISLQSLFLLQGNHSNTNA